LKSVKLPFLNVELPLIGFFVLGPLLFLIVHAYVLLHMVRLATKVGDFRTELQRKIAGEEDKESLLRQLPSNVILQFLAGTNEVAAVRLVQWLIAQVSLVFLPLALLVFFQLQFLPYHDEAISWWHRVAVFLDLVLLWMLWLRVARGETGPVRWRTIWRRKSKWGWGLICLLPVWLVFAVGTFPGEWQDEHLRPLRILPISWVPIRWASAHELLVGGAVDELTRRPKSLLSNRLVLPGIDVNDHMKLEGEAKISGITETISLRGRRLEGAVLSDTHLRKAEFTGAHLEGAVLAGADLRETKFGPWRTDYNAGLNVTEQSADLRGAVLSADLRGATLIGAQLQGANLNAAQLQGANFLGAQLQGAMLSEAKLQGASLSGAELQLASLSGAELQGADLSEANLQGADLSSAWLEGALTNTQLQGAWLTNTQLQGARFSGGLLQGALLDHIFVWRADVRHAIGGEARVVSPETAPKYISSSGCIRCPSPALPVWASRGAVSAIPALRLVRQFIRGAEATNRAASPRGCPP
jgi:uncharacterized protein YjbI with pentapeptide repeats